MVDESKTCLEKATSQSKTELVNVARQSTESLEVVEGALVHVIEALAREAKKAVGGYQQQAALQDLLLGLTQKLCVLEDSGFTNQPTQPTNGGI